MPVSKPTQRDYVNLYYVFFSNFKLNKRKRDRLFALGWLDEQGKTTAAGRARRAEAIAAMGRHKSAK